MSDYQRKLAEMLTEIVFNSIDEEKDLSAMDYDINQEVIEMIVNERLEAGMTQTILSGITGISQANISKIENGQVEPSITTLKRIADALNKRLVISFEDFEEGDYGDYY